VNGNRFPVIYYRQSRKGYAAASKKFLGTRKTSPLHASRPGISGLMPSLMVKVVRAFADVKEK
jgi:hypothetical protein